MSKIVTTVKGEKANRIDCRYIQGEYYKIGNVKVKNSGDCYLINGRYYRDTPYITWDYRNKIYDIYNQSTFESGVVDINGEDLIFGNFYINNDGNDVYIYTKNKSCYKLLSEDLVKNNFYYKENIQEGDYYHRNIIPCYKFMIPSKINDKLKRSLNYNADNIIPIAKKNYDKSKFTYDSDILMYYKDLNNLTFGLEFETTKGFIPKYKCYKNGLIPLRDGSISGLEYVTIPLQGKKGLQSLSNSINLLKERTEYDKDCSLHLHIGNIPRTEKFIIALFKIMLLIQDDVFNMFPLYKKYNFGYKRKNYTKPLPIKLLATMDKEITDDNIKSNFSKIFEFLSMGIPYTDYNNDLNNVDRHPADPGNSRKWNIKSRYYWFNVIPLIFGNKQTVEFRIHTPTYNKGKIMNFLFLCTCIINYTKNNTKKILKGDSHYFNKITLERIVKNSISSSDLRSDIYDYIHCRTNEVYRINSRGKMFEKESKIRYTSRYWKLNIIKKPDIKKVNFITPKKIRRNISDQLIGETEEIISNYTSFFINRT